MEPPAVGPGLKGIVRLILVSRTGIRWAVFFRIAGGKFRAGLLPGAGFPFEHDDGVQGVPDIALAKG